MTRTFKLLALKRWEYVG